MEKKKKKRVIVISGVVLLVVLLAGFGIVTAGGMHRGFHPGFNGRSMHSGFHDRDMSDFMLWRLDKGVEELNLSKEQKDQYTELRAKIEAAISDGKDIRTSLKNKIHSEFEKETPDLEFIAETLKGHMNEINGFIQENLDHFKEFYGTLEAEQKEQIIDEIKERMEYCKIS